MSKETRSHAEARNTLRHQVQTPLFFMKTENEVALPFEKHHCEGEIIDVSETGFKFKTSLPMNDKDQISFEILSDSKTLFSGVAEVIHSSNELVYGAHYLKVKQH